MIVVPALHPAHDVLVRIDELTPGLVHRVGPGAFATGVGGKAVNAPADVRKALADARSDGKRTILMRVKSEGGTRFVALPVGRA